MTTGKTTPTELVEAATEIQHRFDVSVRSIEEWLRADDLEPDMRRRMRAALVVHGRLSRLLARIIANGAAAPASGDVE